LFAGGVIEGFFLVPLSFVPYQYDISFTSNSQDWEMRADRVGNVTRRKMRVMLFSHSRAGMTELFGNDPLNTCRVGSCRFCPRTAHHYPLLHLAFGIVACFSTLALDTASLCEFLLYTAEIGALATLSDRFAWVV